MPSALEPDLADRLRAILDAQGLVTDGLPAVLAEIDERLRIGRTPSHSVHLDVHEVGTERRLHFRALVWRSARWRRTREACIEHHRALHGLAMKRSLAFRVPAMVRSGTSPLSWDLTEWVPGVNLPWTLTKRDGLARHHGAVPVLVAIAGDLGGIDLQNVPARHPVGFIRQVGQWSAWAERLGVVEADERIRMVEIARAAVRQGQWVGGSQLAHGDFGPNNVLMPTTDGDRPWLIDFDDLRRSAPGDALGRLATVSYSEPQWCRAVVAAAENALDDAGRLGFRAMAVWHALGFWRQMATIEAATKVASLDDLGVVAPWAHRQLTAHRKVFRRNFLSEGN